MLIKCTEHLLAELRKESPQQLAKGNNIVGNVLIHPSVVIDPSSKVFNTLTFIWLQFCFCYFKVEIFFFVHSFFLFRLVQMLRLVKGLLLVLVQESQIP
jgi:hypothetical protein